MLCREYTQDKKCPGSLESILEITPARSARMYREYYEAEHKETWQEVLVMSIWGWKPTGDKRIHVTDLFSLQRTAWGSVHHTFGNRCVRGMTLWRMKDDPQEYMRVQSQKAWGGRSCFTSWEMKPTQDCGWEAGVPVRHGGCYAASPVLIALPPVSLNHLCLLPCFLWRKCIRLSWSLHRSYHWETWACVMTHWQTIWHSHQTLWLWGS